MKKKRIYILSPVFISLPVFFAQSFRRNNVVGHKMKEKLLFYVKVECMCNGKLVFPFQKIETKKMRKLIRNISQKKIWVK